MISYPQINPVAFSLGPLKVHWYGISYLLSFMIAWMLAKYRLKTSYHRWNNEIITDFIIYAAFGALIGGRVGYVLFYEINHFMEDPWHIVKIWQGGMSFHGGLIGVSAALLIFARKMKLNPLLVLDYAAPIVPPGLALGRIANFINGEVFGRITSMPWGMVFPTADSLPRHPSQLYEAFVEGLILFIVLWIYTKKPRVLGSTSGLFLGYYGVGRFCCEFFREPDAHLGFIFANWLTMGQILSIPLILIGIWLFHSTNKSKNLN